jgi:hypothetical protein
MDVRTSDRIKLVIAVLVGVASLFEALYAIVDFGQRGLGIFTPSSTGPGDSLWAFQTAVASGLTYPFVQCLACGAIIIRRNTWRWAKWLLFSSMVIFVAGVILYSLPAISNWRTDLGGSLCVFYLGFDAQRLSLPALVVMCVFWPTLNRADSTRSRAFEVVQSVGPLE